MMAVWASRAASVTKEATHALNKITMMVPGHPAPFATAARTAMGAVHAGEDRSRRCGSMTTTATTTRTPQWGHHENPAGRADAQEHLQQPPRLRATTVLCVRKAGEVVIMADGQMTLGSEVMKTNVRKLRRMGTGDAVVIGGFAGATTDAFTLFERLEQRLEAHPGQLMRAAVDLAKAWRTDRYLRRLNATMIVADGLRSLTITGDGNVIEAADGLVAIGSGGSYALAAARAFMEADQQAGALSARDVAEKAMAIAADICLYTNHEFPAESIACRQHEEKKG